jgi:hypothetical protein
MPAGRPFSPGRWGVAFLTLTTSAACASQARPPLVPRARLVPIRSEGAPTPTAVISPTGVGPSARTIVVHVDSLAPGPRVTIHGKNDGPPPLATAPAFLIDGQLWCPRRGPTGRYTEVAARVQALDAGAITSVEVIRGAAAARYARRCAAPVGAVVRVQTRTSPR